VGLRSLLPFRSSIAGLVKEQERVGEVWRKPCDVQPLPFRSSENVREYRRTIWIGIASKGSEFALHA
jgi:hypothetical protein